MTIMKSTSLIAPHAKYLVLHFVPHSVNQRESESVKVSWSQAAQKCVPIARHNHAVMYTTKIYNNITFLKCFTVWQALCELLSR